MSVTQTARWLSVVISSIKKKSQTPFRRAVGIWDFGFGFGVSSYGMIGVERFTDSAVPTIRVNAWFASWHTYSNSSVPFSQRRLNPPVNGAVYAPGSSMVTSYFIVAESRRVNFSVV